MLKLAFQLFIIKLIKDKIMTLASDMQAALPQLQAQHGLTADQVNAAVATAITPIQTTITGILTSEKSDEDKLADISTALGELTTAFAPATPAPVADSTPVAPTPAPAPVTPAPDAAPVTPAPDAAPITTQAPSA